MQITPTFMPAEPTNLEIEVKFNQDEWHVPNQSVLRSKPMW